MVIILLNYSNKSFITSLIDKSNELVNKPIIISETPHVLVGNDITNNSVINRLSFYISR